MVSSVCTIITEILTIKK